MRHLVGEGYVKKHVEGEEGVLGSGPEDDREEKKTIVWVGQKHWYQV